MSENQKVINMSEEKTTSYELIYFGVRGLGEMIRLLFHYTKTPFTDTVPADWKALKPTMPLGQLPVLIQTVNGEKFEIPQSYSIMRHMARLKGLYGANEREHVRADVVSDTFVDFRVKFYPVAREKEKGIAFFNNDLPALLTLAQKMLENSGSQNGYFVCNNLTYADIVAFDFLDTISCIKSTVFKDFEKLAKFVEKIRSLDTLKEYLASRKKFEPTFIVD